MGRIKVVISEDEINLNYLAEETGMKSHGAMNTFIGFVRDFNMERKVEGIVYDCFVPLTQKVIEDIVNEAVLKFENDAYVMVFHRFGRIEVKEPCVLIVANTRHRDESYKITRYVIEELKQRAPIWKKEFYVDGESEWVKGHALCQHKKGNVDEINWCDS